MKQKLVESFSKDWKSDYKPVKIGLNEKNTHISLKEGKYDALVAYKLPIWRLGEKNFNERIYPQTLGEKVVKENKVTVVLDNHPEDKDNPGLKEIIAIGKNPSIEGNILYAECYFIDKELSEKVERATDLGFFFEQSSSGYGELEGNTVVAETYDLERYFDLLLSDSSYNVSFGDENKIVTEKKVEEKEEVLKEKDIINKENIIMEKDTKVVVSKEDKLIKLSLENKLREASKIEDLKERYTEYSSVMEYFEDFDNVEYASELKESVVKELADIQVKIDALTEKGKELDKVVEEKETSLKSLDEANEAIKTLKEEKEKVDNMLEKAIKELDEGKEVYTKLKDLYENKVAEMNTMVDPDDYIALINEFEKVVEAKGDSDKDDDEKGKEKKDGTGPHGKGDGPGKGKADGSGMKDDSDEEEKKKKKEAKEDDNKDSDKEDDKDSKKDDKEDDEKKDKKSDEDKDEKKSSKKESSFKLVKKIIEEKKKENLDEVKYTKKHPDLNIEQQSNDIVEYYNDLVSRYGENVADFKESFLKLSTITEVQNFFFKIRPLLNERTKMPSTARRGVIDRTVGETRKSYNEKHNLTEKVSLDNTKSKGWI